MKQDISQKIKSIPKSLVLLVILAALIPIFLKNTYYLRIINIFFIYSMFAISWDILGGYIGIVSFGHALFFGSAAYTTAVLNIKFGFPPYIAFPFSLAVAVLLGLIIAVPCMRLSGHYLTLATFAFPTILIDLFHAFPNVFGSDVGIPGISPLSKSIAIDYYILLVMILAVYLVARKIVDSDIGLILKGLQSNEAAVISCGIDTAQIKLKMFLVSGLFAGIAGFFHAHTIRVVGPDVLSLHLSIYAVVMCIIGGIGTIIGPIFGSVIVSFATELLRFVGEYRILIFNLILLLIIMFMPEGLTTFMQKNRKGRRSCEK